MNKDVLKKKLYAENFRINNGKVLRTINILRTSYNKLKSVGSVIQDEGIEEWEFLDCINYLSQEGYINLRLIGTKERTVLADCERYDLLEANLTSKGIRLLAGGIDDPVVEV